MASSTAAIEQRESSEKATCQGTDDLEEKQVAGLDGDQVDDPSRPTQAEERALIRRQDVRIMTLSIWTYLLCYLDRSNIGNAKVLNHETHNDLLTSTSMTSYQYTIALMLFFVAYIVWETPSNWMLKRLGPRRWIAILCGVWGMLTMVIGATQNFAGVAAVRFVSKGDDCSA